MNGGMDHIFRLRNGKSRSINWENRRGEKGKGGMASSDLGPSRKGSPCIPTVHAGETVTLAEIEGPGILQHIWITVTDRVRTETGLYSGIWCFVCTGMEKRRLLWKALWEIFFAAVLEFPIL